MGMSRSARISLLLAIDVVFFFVELISGYAVGSLALVADSFHMLNDVMSLVVALYAIKLTAQGSTDSRYSYGWHRAEILAALVNGVFLLALCFSISIEAIERFFSTPEISNPKLIVIVGSLGLASNIVGLFLFHEHSHSHSTSRTSSPYASKTPSVVGVPPSSSQRSRADSTRVDATCGDVQSSTKTHRASTTKERGRSDSYSSLYGHPVATRASLVQVAQDMASGRSPSPKRHMRGASVCSPIISTFDAQETLEEPPDTALTTETIERTPLLISYTQDTHPHDHTPAEEIPSQSSHDHSHSHSGSMNMRALLLHVFGDALGNVGVIATGLVIWLTEWKYKFYFDPVISLVITTIIFSSALPLVRSASFILLQAVPTSVSPESVRTAILCVPGVLSLHELHIWQLSESKLIASVHIMASRQYDFMTIAKGIRKVLHEHGVHSCTVQPEYANPSDGRSPEGLETISEGSCLIRCPADQVCDPQENSCCPPPTLDV